MMKAVRNSEQPGHRERARLGSIQFPARPWNTARTSRGTFCCACSVNFSLIRETADMCLHRFPAQELRK